MSKCPSCKEEIEYLFQYRIRTIKSVLKANNDNPIPCGELYRDEYTCPVCATILAYDALKAMDILEGKIENIAQEKVR